MYNKFHGIMINKVLLLLLLLLLLLIRYTLYTLKYGESPNMTPIDNAFTNLYSLDFKNKYVNANIASSQTKSKITEICEEKCSKFGLTNFHII